MGEKGYGIDRLVHLLSYSQLFTGSLFLSFACFYLINAPLIITEKVTTAQESSHLCTSYVGGMTLEQ